MLFHPLLGMSWESVPLLSSVFHTWQDAVLSMGSAGLDISLIPTILDRKRKPPIITNLLFTVIVLSQALVYGSYHDAFAVATTLFGAGEWALVLGQTVWMRHNETS